MFFILGGKIKRLKTCSHEILLTFSNQCLNNCRMMIFTIQNVVWPNYYRSLVNRIIDSNALYVLFLFVFVGLRSMSTAMVIAGRDLTTLFLGRLEQAVDQ